MYPPDFWHEIALQLMKDFGGELGHWNPELFASKQQIEEALLAVVGELLCTDKSKMRNVIYRVDIPEARLGVVLSSQG